MQNGVGQLPLSGSVPGDQGRGPILRQELCGALAQGLVRLGAGVAGLHDQWHVVLRSPGDDCPIFTGVHGAAMIGRCCSSDLAVSAGRRLTDGPLISAPEWLRRLGVGH